MLLCYYVFKIILSKIYVLMFFCLRKMLICYYVFNNYYVFYFFSSG